MRLETAIMRASSLADDHMNEMFITGVFLVSGPWVGLYDRSSLRDKGPSES